MFRRHGRIFNGRDGAGAHPTFVCSINSGDGDWNAGPKRFGASIGLVAFDVKRLDHEHPAVCNRRPTISVFWSSQGGDRARRDLVDAKIKVVEPALQKETGRPFFEGIGPRSSDVPRNAALMRHPTVSAMDKPQLKQSCPTARASRSGHPLAL